MTSGSDMDREETARRKLLEEAFRLALSSHYADHRSVLSELQRSPDYPVARVHLESPGVRKQIDMLCCDAQRKASRRKGQ
jgi:hypothetical protein